MFLTGGSSFIPAVRNAFETRFDAHRLADDENFQSVAFGLALTGLEDDVGPSTARAAEYATFMDSPSTFQRTFSALLLRRNIVAEAAKCGWLTSWGNSLGPSYTKVFGPALRARPDPGFPAVASVSSPTAPSGPPTPNVLRPLDQTPGPVKSSTDPRSASTCG